MLAPNNLALGEELLYRTSDILEVNNYNEYALTLFVNSNFEDAIYTYEKSLQLEPNNVHALLYQGYSYTEIGENEKARQNYQKIFQTYPIHLTAYNAMGDTYFYENEFEQAKTWYQKTLAEDPFESYAAIRIGDVLLGLEDYEDAINQYQKIYHFLPPDDSTRNKAKRGEGIALFLMGDYYSAISSLSKSLLPDSGRYNNDPLSLAYLSVAHLKVNECDDSIKYNERFKRLDFSEININERRDFTKAQDVLHSYQTTLIFNCVMPDLLLVIGIVLAIIGIIELILRLYYRFKRKKALLNKQKT